MAAFRRILASVALISAFSNALGLASSLFVLQIYDRVLVTKSAFTLVLLLLIFLVMQTAGSILELIRARILTRLATVFDTSCAPALITPIIAHGSSINVGDRPIEDLNLIRQTFTSPTTGALFDVFWTPIYFAAAFLLHPYLGWSLVALAGLLVAIVIASQKAMSPLRSSAVELRTRESALLRAIAGVLPVARVIHRADQLAERWLEARRKDLKALVKLSDVTNVAQTATRTFRGVSQLLAMAAAAGLAILGEVSFGAIFATSILASRGLLPLELITSSLGSLRETLAALRRVREALASRPIEASPVHATTALVQPFSIEASRVYAAPGPGLTPIIQNLNVEVTSGTVFGIVGPVGSGKSTLVRTLLGDATILSGSLKIGGTPIHSPMREPPPCRIGYLPQAPRFLSGTVRENLATFASGSEPAMLDNPFLGCLRHSLDTVLEPDGGPLSDGERQLMALARATLGTPDILVLDTPETALDPNGQALVERTMQSTRDAGGLVILVSHLPRLLRHCTRIAVVESGQIARTISPTDLREALQPMTVPVTGTVK